MNSRDLKPFQAIVRLQDGTEWFLGIEENSEDNSKWSWVEAYNLVDYSYHGSGGSSKEKYETQGKAFAEVLRHLAKHVEDLENYGSKITNLKDE